MVYRLDDYKNAYPNRPLAVLNKFQDCSKNLHEMSLDELKRKKLAHITAIPTGRYQVTMNVICPKMSRSNFYKQFGGGRVPRLLNVPAYEGILIHCGNTAKDTDGCILVGKNTKVGMVLDSKITYSNLYPLLEATSKRNEKIFITVE